MPIKNMSLSARSPQYMLGATQTLIDKNPSSNILGKKTNKNCIAPYCVDSRLKQDIRSNHFVSRQKITQLATLITVLMSSGCFDTPRISERLSRCLVLSTIVCHGAIRTFRQGTFFVKTSRISRKPC